MERWRLRARQIKRDTHAVYFACRDPRTPWYAKVFAALVVAYALSPIDLIPDFIPVLGYLDDLILVPIGITIALRMIPGPVMDECRVKAQLAAERPTNWVAAGVIASIWIALAVVAATLIYRRLASG